MYTPTPSNMPIYNNNFIHEIRRKSITESNAAISGIFFVVDDILIPSYLSESFDGENRYNHKDFFNDYIKSKYGFSAPDFNYLPRGRVYGHCNLIYLSSCILNYDNEYYIPQLKKIYRLEGSLIILSGWHFLKSQMN